LTYVIPSSDLYHVFCSIIFHNVPFTRYQKTGGNIVRTVLTVTPPPKYLPPCLWRHLVVIIIIINCQQPVNTISIQLISIRFAVLDNKSTYKNPKPQKTGLTKPAPNHIVSHNHILASHHFCALTIHPFE